jgi:hypothetical protein
MIIREQMNKPAPEDKRAEETAVPTEKTVDHESNVDVPVS